MYSQKLKSIIGAVSASDGDQIRRAALTGLRIRLESEAPSKACLRCEAGDFWLTWQPLPAAPDGDDEWVPILGRCEKLMNLPSSPEGGLVMPIFQFPHCTSMVTSGDQS